jgi:type II secretory pathway component PulF
MSRHLSLFTGQLAAMLKGGLPLTSALNHLSTYPHRGYAKTAKKAQAGLEAGKPFFSLLAPTLFPALCRRIIQVGEENDSLIPALELLQHHYKRREEFSKRMARALFYPCLLLAVALFGGLFALWQVVPTFQRLYRTMAVEVPPATARVFAISSHLTPQGFLITLVISAAIIITLIFRGKSLPWKVASRITILGDLGCFYFCQVTLMTILVGNNLEKALALTAETFPQGPAKAAHGGLVQGIPLHQAISCPPLLSSFLAQGEAVGELPQALERAAEYYRQRSEENLENIHRYAEPITVMLVGMVILVMLLVLMMPMLQLAAVL